ncbi:cytochrome c oxidase subunit II [Phenylobacterium montanum]|uniref:Cytochrome c oxidase subunit 2 n=2 Tax=Phenylobacterium montanum TaxID=2823693 RepID=A0A975FY39_9CAUL|nr:cytochrome c oxidase subunit II [Caulobacter sp. S6]QUD87291.1 cytochrome c oxidase subunit II [Caulobacter sp. S6]
MRAEALLMRRLRGAAVALGTAALAAGTSVSAWAADAVNNPDIVGQPVDGAMGLQPAHSPLKFQAIAFHDHLLLPIITVISLFVLALLMICVVRFNKRANPVPAKWSHNTPIEILWTTVPVLILMVIAVFSFKLLFAYHAMPKPDLTVKATGYQWYWGYEYPEQKIPEFTSNVLTKEDAAARNEPYLLAADKAMVVPVHKTVHVLVTGADVIHDFGLPAFGIKIDAVPGRMNDAWFNADKTGIYYGQCDQLCGVNHAFMPIEIKVVSQADFDAWVAQQHAPAPAATPAAAPAPAAKPAAGKSASAAAPQHLALNTQASVAAR